MDDTDFEGLIVNVSHIKVPHYTFSTRNGNQMIDHYTKNAVSFATAAQIRWLSYLLTLLSNYDSELLLELRSIGGGI